MAYLFTSGGTAPKTNLSDIRYEEEQELQQVAWRFMKKRDKERKAREAKEQARAEKEKLKAQKKALKDLQKSGAKKTVSLRCLRRICRWLRVEQKIMIPSPLYLPRQARRQGKYQQLP
nr:uncharacterized protein LOC128694421 isoform X2 [Cherax quadricarinatus]